MRSNLDECDDWYNAKAMEEFMNRDYFARPIQGARSSYDYGRSGPIEPLAPEPSSLLPVGIIFGVVAIVPVLWVLGW